MARRRGWAGSSRTFSCSPGSTRGGRWSVSRSSFTLAADAVETATTVGPGWPVRLDADEPVEVVGDAAGLRQVIDNLLANVRAHTPEGTAVTVRVARQGDEAVVEVADRGPGMTDDEATHVFERFYRADPSRSRVHGGTGLGLSIVAAIVAAHGGRVTAASAVGGGRRSRSGCRSTGRRPSPARPRPTGLAGRRVWRQSGHRRLITRPADHSPN